MNKKDRQKEKQERLAKALRENLKKRKQQPCDYEKSGLHKQTNKK